MGRRKRTYCLVIVSSTDHPFPLWHLTFDYVDEAYEWIVSHKLREKWRQSTWEVCELV